VPIAAKAARPGRSLTFDFSWSEWAEGPGGEESLTS